MRHAVRLLLVVLTVSVLAIPRPAAAQSYTENFDDIGTLGGKGFFIQNNSAPLGTSSWFQGNPTPASGGTGPFDAYKGAPGAYIAVNYDSTAGGVGIISNWLGTPNRTFRNGDVFTFYTRKADPDQYPDRLEVRLSTNGASTYVGSGATTTGDFTTLLLSINPSLVTGVYPVAWTQYTITISGLPAPTSGRIAFRYYVTGAGPSGSNSDYIGIDDVVYTPYVCPALIISPATLVNGQVGWAYTQSLSQTGALGSPTYGIIAGGMPPGLIFSSSGGFSSKPTATGTFNFTVGVSDNSGCGGTRAYSIQVDPGPLTVTADAQRKIIGEPDPPLTYAITNGSLVGGDTLSGALSRTAGETVGTYPILQDTLAADDNYVLTYVGANLEIVPVEIISHDFEGGDLAGWSGAEPSPTFVSKRVALGDGNAAPDFAYDLSTLPRARAFGPVTIADAVDAQGRTVLAVQARREGPAQVLEMRLVTFDGARAHAADWQEVAEGRPDLGLDWQSGGAVLTIDGRAAFWVDGAAMTQPATLRLWEPRG